MGKFSCDIAQFICIIFIYYKEFANLVFIYILNINIKKIEKYK